MDSTHVTGLLLVGFSAALLALHWQQRRDLRDKSASNIPYQKFAQHQLRRRTLASSLVGLIGAALTVYDQVPPGPMSVSIYLFGLIFLTCWVFCLGLSDLVATRRFRQREQIDRITAEFRQANLAADPKKSIKT